MESLNTEVADLTTARDLLLEQKAGLEGDLAGLKDTSANEIAGLMADVTVLQASLTS